MHERIAKALSASGAEFRERRHADLPPPIRSPKDFAAAIGYPLSRITKSLFLRDRSSEKFAVAVCSVDRKLDLIKLAAELRSDRLELASPDVLRQFLDYPPTGVSPLGVEAYPVFLDEGIFTFETVLVGGGVVGVEIEIAPDILQRISNGKRIALVLN
jgi:Cys-tRNA(Pro)/Cys-tRNA(Cys) deacylase